MIIRIRLSRFLVERIDKLVGKSRRNQFILEAILWRLDLQDPAGIPPTITQLAQEIEDLRERLEHLEEIHKRAAQRDELSATIRTKVCRDDLDRELLRYLLKHNGATTVELADAVGRKRRTIHDRLTKLNDRAIEITGGSILRFERGYVGGKRNAWWIDEPELLTR